MRAALVGHTGFVGGNLRAQHAFDALFSSESISGIDGLSFDLVVCAGAPAMKWKANREPEADRANLASLMGHLGTISARRFVLVSTVDVYPSPADVDEESRVDPVASSPYGRHRFELETFARERFDATVIRLPALFGPGLKKNAIYDLLHDNCLELLQPRSVFQLYDLAWLWPDVERVLAAGVRVVNFATEPLLLAEVAEQVFGRTLPESEQPVARYRFLTRHAALWGRRDGFMRGRDEVLERLGAFVTSERARLGR